MAKIAQKAGLTLTFKHERETKGTHRYQQVAEDGSEPDSADVVVPTLYIRKCDAAGPIADADMLTMTITAQ